MTTQFQQELQRRRFLSAIASGAALALAGCASTTRTQHVEAAKPKAAGEPEVSPGEDLMREHGVLERILLVYEEVARRLDSQGNGPLDVLAKSANIVRRFVEDYHERLEEQFLFPRFEAARREVELVRTLRAQHARGRELTDQVIHLATNSGRDAAGRSKLVEVLRAFSRMYRPHAAREDTVLFPAFQDLVGAAAYMELGEEFEEREHGLFGKDGFGDVVREVTSLEQALGIDDLNQFTTT